MYTFLAEKGHVPFTVRRARKLQRERLSHWQRLLKPHQFSSIKMAVETHNKTHRAKTGREVLIGAAIDNIVVQYLNFLNQ